MYICSEMNRVIRVSTIVLFLVVIQIKSFSQQIELKTIRSTSEKFNQKTAQVAQYKNYLLSSDIFFTSLSIQVNESQSFKGAYIIVKKDTFYLSRDEHVDAINGFINANLVSFEEPISTIQFYTNQIENTVLFNFINGNVSKLEQNQSISNIESDCLSEPESISQQLWRAGLKSPNYSRSFSTIDHVIIHHSAGSNTNTNYTQVVRDIYIYHTEVNGWSDIGYNYLIAQDGTIFRGRDPESGEQDNVRGAHFCGMNTGTMGVCLLGDYTSIAPTDATTQSLLTLLSWKLDKENLNAFENFSFNSILSLGAIAGHRDGCATECPGIKTYQKIESFKSNVNSIIETCYPDKLIADFTWSEDVIVQGESVSFTDASLGTPLLWEWQFDGSEKEVYTQQNPSNVVYPNVGEFNVSLVVRNGSRTDTAIINTLIKVNENPFNVPSAFPNPVAGEAPLVLNFNKDIINKVEVINSKGQSILAFIPTGNQINIGHSNFNAGIYFVRFIGGGKVVQTTKIIVVN